jgi:hypothetical protein
VRAELAVGDHRTQRLDNDTGAEQGGDVGGVVWRGDFDDLQAAQAFGGDETEDFKCLARQEAARFGPAGAWNEAAIDRVDVERDVNGVGIFPGQFKRDLGGLFQADLQRLSGRLCCAGDRLRRPRVVPASRRFQVAPDSWD